MLSESSALSAYRSGFRGRNMMAALLMAHTISIGNYMGELVAPKPTWRTESKPRKGGVYIRPKAVGKMRAKRKVRAKMRQASRRK